MADLRPYFRVCYFDNLHFLKKTSIFPFDGHLIGGHLSFFRCSEFHKFLSDEGYIHGVPSDPDDDFHHWPIAQVFLVVGDFEYLVCRLQLGYDDEGWELGYLVF